MYLKKSILLISAGLLSMGFLAYGFYAKTRPENAGNRPGSDIQLDWPEAGQAAIGSLDAGLLASSSDDEMQRPIASMAKVITALAILEKQPIKPGQTGPSYTITSHDMDDLNTYISKGGSSLPIRVGMKFTQYQALQRMLIASDNCMADILVQRIFGSMESYLLYAQNMLKRMGLLKTVVADASGFSPATVSTPSELVTIGIAALKDPLIAKIVAIRKAEMPVAGSIKNTNLLLGTDGIMGIKTGTTSEAGSCLLFSACYTGNSAKKRIIIGVIMGDKNHRILYSDTRKLLASAKQWMNVLLKQ